MHKKKVVILGGGVGGIVTANHLAKLLPQENEIVLIEKNKDHSFAASYLWLMVNKRTPQQITSPLRKLVDKRVNILFEEVKQIDAESNIISTEKSKINFDYLVIALGAELDKTHLDKQQYGVHNFFTYEGAAKLNNDLQNFRGGSVSIVISSLPYKCPGAPYEGAMLIADFLKNKKLQNNVTINLYTPEPLPLPVAGPELGNSVKDVLVSKGIGFYPQNQLTSINYNEKKIEFASGNSVNYDLLVVIPQHKSPEVVLKSGLVDESGWITVNKDTLETKHNNVFAIGDVTSITIPGRWQPDKPMKLPKAGVFAHSQAFTVSEIIAAKIQGKESKEIFCGDGFCMLEVGEDLAGFAYGDFYGSPHPDVKLKRLGKIWHLGKVLFEKWWLAPIGFRKKILQSLLKIGSSVLKIPVKL
ncbi:MAG: NAD(P)/FAD-dependent oxidoreductase [Ignavibacteriaceae bacterium]|nr:NAD(P)/FAD-dependent oxidoreductase [Ignavibacteriaceae bacterium]